MYAIYQTDLQSKHSYSIDTSNDLTMLIQAANWYNRIYGESLAYGVACRLTSAI